MRHGDHEVGNAFARLVCREPTDQIRLACLGHPCGASSEGWDTGSLRISAEKFHKTLCRFALRFILPEYSTAHFKLQ